MLSNAVISVCLTKGLPYFALSILNQSMVYSVMCSMLFLTVSISASMAAIFSSMAFVSNLEILRTGFSTSLSMSSIRISRRRTSW